LVWYVQRRLAVAVILGATSIVLGGCIGWPTVTGSNPEDVGCDHGVLVAQVTIHNDRDYPINAIITGTMADGEAVNLGRAVVPAHHKVNVPLRQVAPGQLGVVMSFLGTDLQGRAVNEILRSFRGPNNNCVR
jgi:hypothetical protein